MKGKIYKIYNDINDKLYIGKTLTTLEQRFNEHIKSCMRIDIMNRPLYKAMNKYGNNFFHIELIEEVDIELLSQRECYWIEFYNSYKNGYNATKGGDGRQLYDYNLFIELYQKGLTIKEITEYIGCDKEPVHNALKMANIDTSFNKKTNSYRKINAYDKNHILISRFNSESEAAEWLINKGIAKTDSVKNVVSVISRVAQGKRKSAYKMYWEFDE